MVVEGPHQTLIKCVKELKGDNESWSMLSIWIAFKISATDPHQHLTDPYQTLLVEYALSLQLNPSISKQFKTSTLRPFASWTYILCLITKIQSHASAHSQYNPAITQEHPFVLSSMFTISQATRHQPYTSNLQLTVNSMKAVQCRQMNIRCWGQFHLNIRCWQLRANEHTVLRA